MAKKSAQEEPGSWAIGGGLMLGIGIGFFFMPSNPMAFVGSLMSGLGLGLILAAILNNKK